MDPSQDAAVVILVCSSSGRFLKGLLKYSEIERVRKREYWNSLSKKIIWDVSKSSQVGKYNSLFCVKLQMYVNKQTRDEVTFWYYTLYGHHFREGWKAVPIC